MNTPLGPETFELVRLRGQEGLSQLFSFELDLAADSSRTVPFEQLVGEKMVASLTLPGRPPRYFAGICRSFTEAGRSGRATLYRAEVVPKLWLLSRRAGSRIFQDKSVPDILRLVAGDLDPTFTLQHTYEARNYCVQYRESDFDFVSRLMQDEGISYFFEHGPNGDRLVVADSPQGYPPLPDQPAATYDPKGVGKLGKPIVFEWAKTQELRSGKVTLWDHQFELPHKHLEGEATILPAVQVGAVTHHLALQANAHLELYDYPGGYAERFDGIGRSGEERPGELPKLIQEAGRVARIRVGNEAASSISIDGASIHPTFVSGHSFTLAGHFDADGQYVLTSVQHAASQLHGLEYTNGFVCAPGGVLLASPRTRPEPRIPGTQTAYVVGPAGSEVYTDRYGRVKVQFHWDREGKNDSNSSCWIRVSQPFTGQGSLIVPRVGWEVIVAFEEGDPDRPIIVGRAYNAGDVPPRQGRNEP